ncbi:MAG TPA: metallophosphoesterase [Chloroflexi bacterium]|nr:metallophosphoesterase [Chloroflexota bacterium]
MKLAVISDTHDNIWALEAAMPRLRAADAILHCGDLCAPFMIPRLAAAEKPVHIVWGNNDGDKRLLTEQAARYPHIHIHGDFADLRLGGWRIAMTHYPEIARPLAASGAYDLVCYGHDHTAHISRQGKTLLLNPGEIMGLLGERTLALVDTETGEAQHIALQT